MFGSTPIGYSTVRHSRQSQPVGQPLHQRLRVRQQAQRLAQVRRVGALRREGGDLQEVGDCVRKMIRRQSADLNVEWAVGETHLLLVQRVEEDDAVREGVVHQLLQRQARIHARLLQDLGLYVCVQVSTGSESQRTQKTVIPATI